jgi:prostatin (serine protease 8)
MKFLIFCLLVLVTYATASIRIDLYKNTLKDSTTRIINGEKADRGEFPYQVSIRHRLLTIGLRSHLCGGILIQTSWVLTAGHCKQNTGTYDVGLGLLNRDERRKDVQWIDVSKFIVHSEFSGGVSKYDIGLVKLKKPAQITPTVQLINVPSSEDECDVLTKRTLSGWGRTSGGIIATLPKRLQKADLPIIPEEECSEKLIKLLGNDGPLDDTMVCTLYDAKKPQSACMGDSGGPLADLKNKTIIGIVSWGITPCGTKNAPSVYTNVCAYRDWIEETIEENSY